MPENPKQIEGIECGRDAGEHETKRRDRIWAICLRTRNKKEGSNPNAITENLKQMDGIEFGFNAREFESK